MGEGKTAGDSTKLLEKTRAKRTSWNVEKIRFEVSSTTLNNRRTTAQRTASITRTLCWLGARRKITTQVYLHTLGNSHVFSLEMKIGPRRFTPRLPSSVVRFHSLRQEATWGPNLLAIGMNENDFITRTRCDHSAKFKWINALGAYVIFNSRERQDWFSFVTREQEHRDPKLSKGERYRQFISGSRWKFSRPRGKNSDFSNVRDWIGFESSTSSADSPPQLFWQRWVQDWTGCVRACNKDGQF